MRQTKVVLPEKVTIGNYEPIDLNVVKANMGSNATILYGDFYNSLRKRLLEVGNLEPGYCIVPLNYLLWLKSLGLDAENNKVLFSNIAAETKRLLKINFKTGMKLAEIPIGGPVKAGIKVLEKNGAYRDEQHRTYMDFHGLITAWGFSLWNKKEPAAKFKESLGKIAPAMGLLPVEPYITACIEPVASPTGCITLCAVMPLQTAVCVTLMLMEQATIALHNKDGIGSRSLDRPIFGARLITAYELSLDADPQKCLKFARIFGSGCLW